MGLSLLFWGAGGEVSLLTLQIGERSPSDFTATCPLTHAPKAHSVLVFLYEQALQMFLICFHRDSPFYASFMEFDGNGHHGGASCLPSPERAA